MSKETMSKSDKVVKVLQYIAIALMLVMVVACVWAIKNFGINLKNVGNLAAKIMESGLTLPVLAGLLVAFSIVKSFALVFPPAVLFAVTGLLFRDHLILAWVINFIGTALSLVLPYYLGRFTGKSLVDSLKKKFKAVKKIDDFAGENDFSIVFAIKASGCMPCDISSLVFGAMNISFWKYFIAANIGMLPLNLLWTLLGAKGDLTDPLSFLYVLPILLFAIGVAVYMAIKEKKKNAAKQ